MLGFLRLNDSGEKGEFGWSLGGVDLRVPLGEEAMSFRRWRVRSRIWDVELVGGLGEFWRVSGWNFGCGDSSGL